MKTINHECYVDLEVAKLLKEAGFDWECEYAYMPSTEMGNVPFKHLHNRTNYNGLQYEVYSAPTLDVAQRWLREVKNLILLIDITPSYCDGKPMSYKFVIHISCGNHIWGEWKDTYEEAQEAGIKKALEIILEKGD